jgi:hypothetical protein
MTTSNARSERHDLIGRSIAGPPSVRQQMTNTLILY